jgi:two-component system KDP operon response regulator KdpE
MSEAPIDGRLILVVDDDAVMARMVAVNLAARGYRVREFYNGAEAIECLRRDQADLVILDMLMPGIDGLQVAEEVRRFSQVPILVLSVRDDTSAKLAALELGADDYITKPFRVEELLARVRAILRRTAPAGAGALGKPPSYRSGDLLIDLERMRVTMQRQPVQLTPREWATLKVLVRHAGRVVSTRQLLQEAWGPDYGDEGDYVRTYITRLRRKLEPDPRRPRFILLERGLGYRLKTAD